MKGRERTLAVAKVVVVVVMVGGGKAAAATTSATSGAVVSSTDHCFRWGKLLVIALVSADLLVLFYWVIAECSCLQATVSEGSHGRRGREKQRTRPRFRPLVEIFS